MYSNYNINIIFLSHKYECTMCVWQREREICTMQFFKYMSAKIYYKDKVKY